MARNDPEDRFVNELGELVRSALDDIPIGRVQQALEDIARNLKELLEEI